MRVLHLTLKKKWFDMIASGEKKEEYRDIKPYWFVRLWQKDFAHIVFKNGYNQDSPTITVEFKGIHTGRGIQKWGAEKNRNYFVIKLGEIISKP